MFVLHQVRFVYNYECVVPMRSVMLFLVFTHNNNNNNFSLTSFWVVDISLFLFTIFLRLRVNFETTYNFGRTITLPKRARKLIERVKINSIHIVFLTI